jgi:phage tail-like protein
MAKLFEFRLNIQSSETAWTYVIPIRSEPVIIGRQAGNDLQLDHQQVSRRHAELRCTPSECSLVDLGSANGTRLNGQKLTPNVPVILKQGDNLQIGSFKLTFEQVSVEESIQPQVETIPRLARKKEEDKSIGRDADIPALPPLPPSDWRPRFDPSQPPPGLTFQSERLLSYLPVIYHTEFMANFLGIFEAVLFPVEWQIDNFDLFLNPSTAPAGFLPWLSNWFDIVFDSTWSEAQKRTFLKEAYSIYSRSGTRWALRRMLEIYCGHTLEIEDESQDLAPHTFRVKLPKDIAIDRKHIERLIEACKPTHTAYVLE